MAEFLIITGLSGAGRSQAADTFEDLGWFVIDNMPIALVSKVAELVNAPGSETQRVALVAGRLGTALDELTAALDQLGKTKSRVRVLFLDASDEVLVRRFEGTRRRHPFAAEGVAESIAQERQALQPVKEKADVVVDTSDLNVHQLRDRLIELFARQDAAKPMQTSVVSFGYKHGLPIDVDLVLDCRFLPNPHWVDELRPFNGLDQPVRDYVMGQPETAEFLEKLDDLLGLLLPAYVKEGKSYLTIAVGCTGGQHRSVVLAEEIAKRMAGRGYAPTVNHRDIAR
jgi:RNase adapter protein RapZ